MAVREGARCAAASLVPGAAEPTGASCPLTQLLAEQAGRPEDEHDDEDREDQRPGPSEETEGCRRDLDEADDEPAERRTR